jgi:hypothetical protein
MGFRTASRQGDQQCNDSSNHLSPLLGFLSLSDAESLGVFLLPTQVYAERDRRKSRAADSTQRCNRLLELSKGQAAVHDKFEEFTEKRAEPERVGRTRPMFTEWSLTLRKVGATITRALRPKHERAGAPRGLAATRASE